MPVLHKCLKCGEKAAVVSDVTGLMKVTCNACGAVFTVERAVA